jgi:hypothetical protein
VQNYSILHRVVLRLSQHKLKNFALSPYLKALSNKTVIQIKLVGMSIIFLLITPHLSNNKCNGSWTVSILPSTNCDITFNRPPLSYFFLKNSLSRGCSSFEDMSANKMSWSHVDWCKFCIHLRSLNIRHFGLFEATGLKIMALRSPSMT